MLRSQAWLNQYVTEVVAHECQFLGTIENPDTMIGMWYDKDGNPSNYTHSADGISKDLPMGKDDEHYRRYGKEWYCSCSQKEKMFHWFNLADVHQLYKDGYRFYELDVNEFIEEEYQTLYTRESIVAQKEIPFSEIWVDFLDWRGK